jgi:hypothetical protein
MQPLPKFMLRDIDIRELSICTPAPDRPLPTGSIGMIVAAHPEYGYYLVEFDAPRLLWCSRGRTWSAAVRNAAGRPADDDFGEELARLTPNEMVAKMATRRSRWLGSGNGMIASCSG